MEAMHPTGAPSLVSARRRMPPCARGIAEATARPRALSICLGAVVALFAPEARAQTEPMQRLFFRMALGGGYGSEHADVVGPAGELVTLRYDGGGAFGAFSLGVVVSPGVAVHVDAAAFALFDPAITVSGNAFSRPDSADFTTSSSLVGAGFTWHHRSNFWLSLGGGVTQLSLEFPFERAAGHALSTLGGGAQLLIGHDWQITRHWFVGAAVHGMFGYVPKAPVDASGALATWVVGGVGLAITLGTR